jgi:hypothetical protein
MKDGFILMYVKDGVIYPVALTEEQLEVVRLLVKAVPGTVTIIKDKPQGDAVNLVGRN